MIAPTVSVIAPCRNEKDHIQACIGSILFRPPCSPFPEPLTRGSVSGMSTPMTHPFAGLPQASFRRQSLGAQNESHLSVHSSPPQGAGFWHRYVRMVYSNHIL
jgi:hypothetical protein